MSTEVRGALLLALLCAVVASVWWLFGGEVNDPVEVESEPVSATVEAPRQRERPTLPAVAEVEALALDVPQTTVQRSQAPRAKSPPPRPRSRYRLDVEVIDEVGSPVEGASVLLAPPLQPLNLVGLTDGRGHLKVEWLGRRSRMDVVAFAEHEHRGVSHLRRCAVSVGSERLTLMLQSSAGVRSVEREWVDRSTSRKRDQSLISFEYAALRAKEARAAWSRRPGRGQTPGAWPDGDVIWFQHPLDRPLETPGFTPPAVDGPRRLADFKRISGSVKTSGGRPVPDAAIAVWNQDGRVCGRSRTRKNGRFDLHVERSPRLIVRAVGPQLQTAEQDVTGLHKSDSFCDLVLGEQGQRSRVELRSTSGDPLTGWSVLLESTDRHHPWQRWAPANSAGVVEVTGRPPVPATIALWPPGSSHEPPTWYVDRVLRGDQQLEIPERVLGRGTVRLRVTADDRKPKAGAVVRLWHVPSGRGVFVTAEGRGRHGYAANLPTGRYRGEFGLRGAGWDELADFDVPPAGGIDFGSLKLPSPGEIELISVEADSWDVTLWRVDHHVDALVTRREWKAGPVRVPPGAYIVETGAGHRCQVEVRSGERSRVDLDRAWLDPDRE